MHEDNSIMTTQINETTRYFDYLAQGYTIREDLPSAYREVWNKIAHAGNWWRGEQRVAIAKEVRVARQCKLCSTRKSALSPYAVEGRHDSASDLSSTAVDAIHRLATDASRLTRDWLVNLNQQGLSQEEYVELLGIVVAVLSIDAFHRSMGFALETLPAPFAGVTSQYRPDSARDGEAWVPGIQAKLAVGKEAGLYEGSKQVPGVIMAMSLVPDSVRMQTCLSGVMYLKIDDIADFSKNGDRKISRTQMELLAARVSSLSDCFY